MLALKNKAGARHRAPMSKEKAINTYERHTVADLYLISFSLDGYEFIHNMRYIPRAWIKWTLNADHVYALRLNLTVKRKRKLIREGAICIGKTSELFNKADKYNKGEQIERLIYESVTGNTWRKDCTPWYKGADLEAHGYKVQIKRENGTFTTWTTLKRFVEG